MGGRARDQRPDLVSLRQRGPEADTTLVNRDAFLGTAAAAVIDDVALAWEGRPFETSAMR